MVNYRKNSRKNRKNMRKASRKASRKNTRKNTRRNNNAMMMGGNPMQLSLAQGKEFVEIHQGQRGGGAPLMGAPVGYTGMLDESLRASARIGPLDDSVRAIQGMSDMPAPAVATPEQTGGRRSTTRKNRKSKKNSRKDRKNKKSSRKDRKNKKSSRKDRKNRKTSRKNKKSYRKMHGGSAPITDSFDLLSPAMRMKAGTADFSNPLLLK
jgi:hypothetical protein